LMCGVILPVRFEGGGGATVMCHARKLAPDA
jgi:hypothetical protein